ncbi:YmzC family protein [Bacillus sp. NPDC077027]|uniref:YmzC family protein n=1 Tax=Bacillus sp. NPDC077027 TaxID=3390548 RepID=UPI003CFE421B
MENTELELRRIKVILILIGIILLFTACSIMNNDSIRLEREESHYDHGDSFDDELKSAIPLKNNHFAVIEDRFVTIYRFDEKTNELQYITSKDTDEFYDDDEDVE